MHTDYFQIVRCDGTRAVSELSSVENINMLNGDRRNLLHEAIAYANWAAAAEVIRLGINVNAQDSEGKTPLHFAALSGNVEIAERILEQNGDFSIPDSHGNSPVWTAVFNARGNYSVIELLARHGAARVAAMKNKHGRSPIDFAIQIGDNYLQELLTDPLTA